jgi:hypothetical protein
MLAVGGFFLRSDMDVRSALIKTAASAREAISLQKPMGRPESAGWGGQGATPAWETAATTAISNHTHINMTCDYDMERLKKWQQLYHLEETFEYTKRYVQVARQDIPRKSVTELTQNFLVDAVKVVDVNKQYQAETCPEPLLAPVANSPFPSTANASNFIFGVSTTYKRFTDPRTSPINEWSY